jgi:hypothetical protein
MAFDHYLLFKHEIYSMLLLHVTKPLVVFWKVLCHRIKEVLPPEHQN